MRYAALRARGIFFGQIVLGLRTFRPRTPERRGTKERGKEEGGKGRRPGNHEFLDGGKQESNAG